MTLFEELKDIGLVTKVARFKVGAKSGDQEAQEVIEQVTVEGYPNIEAVINDNLYRKGYLKALGAARIKGKVPGEGGAPKARKTLIPV